MKDRVHLDEDQLIWAVVDEAELSIPARDHLSVCSMCQARKERLEKELARLGQLAEHLAPFHKGRVVLPREQPKASFGWLWNWRVALAAGAAATGVIVVALWFALLMTTPENRVAPLAREIWEDERLMADVRMHEANALSPVHLDITGDSYLVLDEEFMEFVVPAIEDIT